MSTHSPSSDQTTSAQPVRIGLIGCGAVAAYGHLPAITNTPGLELAAVCEPDAARLAEIQKKFGAAQGFTDPAEFFAADLDAVAITSPAPCHAEHVHLAAANGKHVLCEKPLATSDAQAQGMIDAMDAAGRMLVVGFTYRFSPVAMTIKKLIDQGAIGKPRSLRLIYVWDCHGRYNTRDDANSGLQARRQARMDEGGPMVDCGVHQIDLARWWLGQEVTAYTGVGAWVEDHDSPDHVYLHMHHEGGAHTTVEMSYSYGHTTAERRSQFIYDIVGTEGVIRFDRGSNVFEVCNAKGTTSLEPAHEKNFAQMYAAFRDAVARGDASDMPTGRDGLMATKLAVGATEQARQTRATR